MHPFLIWVEGDRDRRFFERIVSPQVAKRHERVQVKEFSQKEKATFNKKLSSYRRAGIPFLLVGDQDEAACVMARKLKLREVHPSLDADHIIVVGCEIESWYAAGISSDTAKLLGIQGLPEYTDNFAKEALEALRPKRFASTIDFLVEILNHYSIDLACRRNSSFAYLMRRIRQMGESQ